LHHPLQLALTIVGWLIALIWLSKVIAAAFGLPRIPNLVLPRYNITPAGSPSITVIVPARNEAAHIAATLHSLLSQDYPNLQIIAIDDRSTDETGAIIDTIAAEHPEKLRALHVTELPPGWLGKTHAMALAARQAPTDYLLFTDADVLFHPTSIRVTLANAVATNADHLVLVPTNIIKRWDEAAILGFFQIFCLWAGRPWRIADPKAKRDAIGLGAFNLLRRSAYIEIGGYESLRMEIIEDLGLGRRIKRAGLAQRITFGRGLVSLHWAPGAPGLVSVMTKNLFAAFHFYISLALLWCLWLLTFWVAPAIGLFFGPLKSLPRSPSPQSHTHTVYLAATPASPPGTPCSCPSAHSSSSSPCYAPCSSPSSKAASSGAAPSTPWPNSERMQPPLIRMGLDLPVVNLY
jgi:glycosyltransferase involved in cell wall biosynthesis